MGWLAGWEYRQKITIENPNSSDLTDFQVQIVLDSSWVGWDYVNADGSDLRFTEDDGKTTIPYYIESWDLANKSCVVWIKVSLISANSSVDVYLYYGNSSASSLSDGNNVFDFFDDFDGTSLDTTKWNEHDGGGASYSVSNSVLEIHTSTSDYSGVWIWNKSIFNSPFIVEAKALRTNALGAGEFGTGILLVYGDWDGSSYDSYYYEPISYIRAVIYRYSKYSRYNSIYDSRNHVGANGNYSGNLGVWTKITLSVIDSVQEAKFDFNLDRVINDDLQLSNTLSYTSFYVGVGAGDAKTDSDAKIDWIRVRKYADSEPTVTLSDYVESYDKFDWLDGWMFKRNIFIDNSNGSDLTDFQIKIDFDSSNFDFDNTNADGSDLRFFTPALVFLVENPNSDDLVDFQVKLEHSFISSGSNYRVWVSSRDNPIPYYIEQDGVMWVKVPKISGNGYVFVYVEEDSSAPSSDGNSVFEFFDDFSSDTGRWTLIGANSAKSYEISNGMLHLPSFSSNSSGLDEGVYASVSDITQAVVEARMKIIKNTSVGLTGLYFWKDLSTSADVLVFGATNDDDFGIIDWNFDSSGITKLYGFTQDYSDFHTWTIKKDGNTYALYYDGVEETTVIRNTIPLNYVGFGVPYNDNELYVDWVRVRKYTDQEPVVTVYEDFINFYGELPFYIEKWDVSNQVGTVWVKVPYIPAGKKIRISMFYGNSNAVSKSDGNSVFDFFDDFNEQGNWRIVRVGGSGYAKWEDGYLKIKSTSDGTVVDTQYTVSSAIIDWKVKVISNAEAFYPPIGDGNYDSGGHVQNGYHPHWDGWPSTSERQRLMKMVNDEGTTLAQTGDGFLENNNEYIVSFQFVTGNLKEFTNYKEILSSDDTTFSSAEHIGISCWTNAEYWVDWIRVRKYASIEPTIIVGPKITSLIRGNVTYSDGSVISGAHVVSVDASNIVVIDKTTSESDGSFLIGGVPGKEVVVFAFTDNDSEGGDIKPHVVIG